MRRHLLNAALLATATMLGATLGYMAKRYARFEVGLGTWSTITTEGAPNLGIGRTAVWTGTEMIVWGGSGFQTSGLLEAAPDGAVVPFGGRYDPVSDSWRLLSTEDAPSPRLKYTAVWADARWNPGWGADTAVYGPEPDMIIWGGIDAESGEALATGALYTPSLDKWRPVNTVGAPEARWDHTAVWTGKELIVWGGVGADGQTLATGARYDPFSDGGKGVWRPTSTAGAPTRRWQHSGIWTGTEMTVWGGAGDSESVATGGRYDPATDSWRPTAIDDAPEARGSHDAIWTGTELLIWGGFSDTPLGDGARYDPVDDSWAGIASAGAPLTVDGHVAVWTGSEMIVYGESLGWTVTGDEAPPRMSDVPAGARYLP